jgi:hypothetical protein
MHFQAKLIAARQEFKRMIERPIRQILANNYMQIIIHSQSPFDNLPHQ